MYFKLHIANHIHMRIPLYSCMEELLHKAIAEGNDERVRALIENGAVMDMLMGLRGTALCAAISDQKISIASYLIEAGCDVNGEDYDGEPPLMLAMRKECFIIVKKLIDHPKCNVNKADPLFKVTPLCFAAKSGQTEVVDWLINANSDLDSKDGDGNNALQLSIIDSHYKIIEKLVRCGCDIYSENSEGFAPIHTIARIGDFKNLIMFLSPWVDVHDKFTPRSFSRIDMSQEQQTKMSKLLSSVTKFKQETPLLIAVRGGHNILIKIILACGANPNLGDYPEFEVHDDSVTDRNYTTTPLLRACMSFHGGRICLDTIEWLLDAGCFVDRVGMIETGQDKLLLTPLLFAATYDLLDLAKLFVQYGADVNICIGDINPLYQAIIRNSINVMWYLLNDCNICFTGVVGNRHRNYYHAAIYLHDTQLENVLECLASNGGSVNGSDSDGKTPLFWAVEKLDIKYIRTLLKLHANVTPFTTSGDTPLHKSVELGAVEITKLLLTYGAHVNAKNSSDMTPLDVALEDMEDDEHKELAILLLQNGAMVTKKATVMVSLESVTPCFISDSDSGSDDSVSFGNSSFEINLALDTTLKHLIAEGDGMPTSLFMLSVTALRNYFRENKLSFSNILSLPLPKSIIDQVVLK